VLALGRNGLPRERAAAERAKAYARGRQAVMVMVRVGHRCDQSITVLRIWLLPIGPACWKMAVENRRLSAAG